MCFGVGTFQISFQFLALSCLLWAFPWRECCYVWSCRRGSLKYACLTEPVLFPYLLNHWFDFLHHLLYCWFSVMYSVFELLYFFISDWFFFVFSSSVFIFMFHISLLKVLIVSSPRMFMEHNHNQSFEICIWKIVFLPFCLVIYLEFCSVLSFRKCFIVPLCDCLFVFVSMH